MNEEMIQAARAAFKKNPEAACKAILGCTTEDIFCEAVKAARGCNQHAHKPGCPDAEGESTIPKTEDTRTQQRSMIFAEYAEKLQKLNEQYGGKFNTKRHELEDKIAELDAETLAKLKDV